MPTMLGGNENERVKIATEAYGHFMDFIGTLLPNYHRREDVLMVDLLWRYLHDELEDDDDIEFCKEMCEGNKKNGLKILIKTETSFAKECLKEFYEKYFK